MIHAGNALEITQGCTTPTRPPLAPIMNSDLSCARNNNNGGSSSSSKSASFSFGKLPTKYSTRNAARSEHSSSSSASSRQSLPGPSSSILSLKSSPRLQVGKLLNTMLGSPFSSNSGEVLIDGTFLSVSGSQTVTRPASPNPSIDYSFISPPSPTLAAVSIAPNVVSDVFSSSRSPNRSPTLALLSTSRGKGESSLHKSPSKLAKGILPRIWDALSSPVKKGKRKAQNYDDDLPLDGEEGELVDDEACFIDVSTVTGIDIPSLLPTELGLYLFLFLDLPAILACLSVSRHWRSLASDNVIWRELFYREPGWNIDLLAARKRMRTPSSISGINVRLGQAIEDWSRNRLRVYSESSNANSNAYGTPKRISMTSSVAAADESQALSAGKVATVELAPLSLNWQDQYRTRLQLDKNWLRGEPKVTKISGHEDSVYCLEFDSHKIITGSRDKTIKIWSLRTGKLRATFHGHSGSVLCLKFDKTGFMVSGSSDCTVFVWNLNAIKMGSGTSSSVPPVTAKMDLSPNLELEMGSSPQGLLQKVLRGHTGGVLDLRIDSEYIVSCSKDTLIRVWSRKTLSLSTTLRGHEGPVNAVGLQDGKVVSASGDGKMMLWDIATSTRIRTFEGHDRGLACIEFKHDYIISGSNDCKIKVWQASTGECLKTLVGHDLLVRALSFDPVTERLVSASYDRTVKVWDVKTGKMIREFKNGHTSHIFDVKFDACRIVSTSHDQTIIILDFSQNLDTSLFL